jgi:hypothetical protein
MVEISSVEFKWANLPRADAKQFELLIKVLLV